MSTCHKTKIKGIIPKTEKYEKMLNVFNSCINAGIEPPEIIRDFFDLDNQEYGYHPSTDGMEIDISFETEGDEDTEEGAIYTINLSEIPKNVEKIILRSYYC